ncbi:MAG: OprO/OprP family phosphate-selective porin, partial [Planctomycetota bacterium]
KLQFDFAGSDADLKDAYLGLKDFPFGNIRGGHFKEPFGLEELTSSKYITFMERSLPMEAFAPSRNAGLMLFDTALEDRMTWAVGIFRNTDDYGEGQDDGGYNFTGRLTTLPVYQDNGASLIHLGIGYSHRNPDGESAQFRSRPGAHLLDRFVDTSSFACDTVDLLGLEGAWVSGPLSVQGEYVFASADRAGSSSSNANLHGYYIQTSYFLTGEHRKYKPSAGSFSRVKPKENFSFGGGSGAWEVGLRYSGLDLDDSSISGGELDTITAGLNWHLNPNTRIMWNYIHADKDDVGKADMLMTRLQIDF